MSEYKHQNVTCDGAVTLSTGVGNTITTANTGDYLYIYPTPYFEVPQAPAVSIPYSWKTISGSVTRTIDPKEGGDEDMRYLYEVILVNPKNDNFVRSEVVAKSETSALMKAYDSCGIDVEFDDLKTSCRVLMEWKKEKSLKKAIETIKEAVE